MPPQVLIEDLHSRDGHTMIACFSTEAESPSMVRPESKRPVANHHMTSHRDGDSLGNSMDNLPMDASCWMPLLWPTDKSCPCWLRTALLFPFLLDACFLWPRQLFFGGSQ